MFWLPAMRQQGTITILFGVAIIYTLGVYFLYNILCIC